MSSFYLKDQQLELRADGLCGAPDISAAAQIVREHAAARHAANLASETMGLIAIGMATAVLLGVMVDNNPIMFVDDAWTALSVPAGMVLSFYFERRFGTAARDPGERGRWMNSFIMFSVVGLGLLGAGAYAVVDGLPTTTYLNTVWSVLGMVFGAACRETFPKANH